MEIRRMEQVTVPTAHLAYRRHRTCDRKKVYDSEEAGWAAVRYIQHNGNDPFPDFELRPYLCIFCGQIHVGHSNTPKSAETRLQISAPSSASSTSASLRP